MTLANALSTVRYVVDSEGESTLIAMEKLL